MIVFMILDLLLLSYVFVAKLTPTEKTQLF